jgi:hypothetical protein
MEKMCEINDLLAEDAVLIEPVCASNFPDNREINREICKFWPRAANLVSVPRENSAAYDEIPYQM